MGDFEKWIEDQDFYTNMRFIHGDKLFDRDGDVYRVLPVQMAYQAWDYRKAQLNNMEACYIEKKKQVEAVDAVLMNWRDEYTEYTHQHECTVDAVLRTCIAELEQAMRGAHE